MKNKHIVLGITGSIAAYKACSLIRLFVKAGAEVQVVITPAGKEFITPVTLSALTGKPVVSEFFAANDGTWHSHVDLGLWADAMVIAPATASTLGKMSHGIADNMLLTTYMSMKAPVFVAPAMDLDMYRHPATTANLDTLRSRGVQVIEAADGELASHLCGKGRMQEPEYIFDVVDRFFHHQEHEATLQDLAGKRVLITAGPTHEHIDAVRYIGNCSSGKMGLALAEDCAARGAEVQLVCGPVSLQPKHPAIHTTWVTSAAEMHQAATRLFATAHAAILCAAVADFTPAHTAEQKIKREGKAGMTLELVPTPDIAASLGALKQPWQRIVGFALETDNELQHAADKLRRKNLDFIVLNSLRDEGAGFACDTNKVTLLYTDGRQQAYPLKSKTEVAHDIIDALCPLLP